MSSHWQQGSEPANAGQVPVVRNIFDFSSEALGQVRSWLEQNPPSIPVTQIVGFSQFTAQSAETATHESTSSGTYADLATVGPSISSLPDGKYIVLFGCWLGANTAGDAAYMGIQVNSTGAGDGTAVIAPATSVFMSSARAFATTLSNAGSNTLAAKYRCSTAGRTADFQNRWIVALRYANS